MMFVSGTGDSKVLLTLMNLISHMEISLTSIPIIL